MIHSSCRFLGFIALAATLGAASAAEPARKPCGGAILNPAHSTNRKYRIEVGPPGMLRRDREIVWKETEAGGATTVKHRWSNHDLNLKRPSHAWFFIPNTGNGFLLFCPYPGNSFFAFYGLKGKPLVTFAVQELLEPKEISQANSPWGRCVAEGPCSYADYRLAEDPELSEEGWFVDFKAIETGRRIRFFLPLGMPVTEAVEKELLSTLSLTPAQFKAESEVVAQWIRDLDQPDITKRDQASRSLRAKAVLAQDAMESARARPPSLEVQIRVTEILENLPPLGRILRNPELLSSLLFYPSEAVQSAARTALGRLISAPDLPAAPGELHAWIVRNGSRLRWDGKQGAYLLEPEK